MDGLFPSAATILTFVLVQRHMAGDPQCIKTGPREVEHRGGGVGRVSGMEGGGGGSVHRQENREGWMVVPIRPASRDIWQGLQKIKD